MNINIEIIATAASILSEETLFVCLIDSTLKLNLFVPELTTDVDVSSLSSHTETNNKSTLNEFVRIMSQNFSILAGTWLGLITVDDEVGRTTIGNLGHEGVFKSGGETSTTTTAQTRLLDLVNNPIGSVKKDLLSLVPITLYF